MGFKEIREKFIKGLLPKKENGWKQPNLEAIYYYKNRQIPRIYLNDMNTGEKITKYLGENKYSFQTEGLSIEEKYELVKQLINRIADILSEITEGTQKRGEYEKFCQVINTKLNLSSFLKSKQKDNQRAFEILEDFLPQIIDFYNDIVNEKDIIQEKQ